MTLYSIEHIARMHGVSPSTIRRWAAAGLIEKATRTLGGHRRFKVKESEEKEGRRIIGYARVSSHDQKSDLVRQIERLKDHAPRSRALSKKLKEKAKCPTNMTSIA